MLGLDFGSIRLSGPRTKKEPPLHRIRAGSRKRRPHRRCGTTSANARRFESFPTTVPARTVAQPPNLPKTRSAQPEFAGVDCSMAARPPAPALWTSLGRSSPLSAVARASVASQPPVRQYPTSARHFCRGVVCGVVVVETRLKLKLSALGWLVPGWGGGSALLQGGGPLPTGDGSMSVQYSDSVRPYFKNRPPVTGVPRF